VLWVSALLRAHRWLLVDEYNDSDKSRQEQNEKQTRKTRASRATKLRSPSVETARRWNVRCNMDAAACGASANATGWGEGVVSEALSTAYSRAHPAWVTRYAWQGYGGAAVAHPRIHRRLPAGAHTCASVPSASSACVLSASSLSVLP